jgi:hypothetical protein
MHGSTYKKEKRRPYQLHSTCRHLARRIVPVVALFISLIWVTGRGEAQSLGYGFIGATAGDLSGAFRYGLGAEWATAPHLSIGGEIGGLQKNSSGLLVSGNLTGHLRPIGSALDPFVTGGISVAHISHTTGAYGNVGGGVNYWWNSHLAFRGEFRGYLGGGDLPGFGEFRFGISFR